MCLGPLLQGIIRQGLPVYHKHLPIVGPFIAFGQCHVPQGLHGGLCFGNQSSLHALQAWRHTVGRQFGTEHTLREHHAQQLRVVALGHSLLLYFVHHLNGRFGQVVINVCLGLLPQFVITLCRGAHTYAEGGY